MSFICFAIAYAIIMLTIFYYLKNARKRRKNEIIVEVKYEILQDKPISQEKLQNEIIVEDKYEILWDKPEDVKYIEYR